MTRLPRITLLFLTVALAGCAGSLSPTLTGSSREVRRTDFTRSQLAGLSVAVFPAMAEPQQREAAKKAQKALLKTLRESLADVRWIAPKELEGRALGAGVGRDWEALRNLPSAADAPNRETLDRFATALGIRFVFFPRIILERTEAMTRMTLTLSLWDSRSGTLLWHGEGQSTGRHEIQSLWGPIYIPVPMRELGRSAATALVERMP